MARIAYKNVSMGPEKLDALKKALAIVNKYRQQGLSLTLRQIYYQFVARDWFPEERRFVLVNKKWVRNPKGTKNAEPNYDWLGCVLADARMGGYMDWDAMIDRTREKGGNLHWESPEARIKHVAEHYLIDTWQGQPYRPEVWVEKDAMENIVEVICRRLDTPYFSCRGYSSLSSLHDNAQVLAKLVTKQGTRPVVLYLGDHDPSGIDMGRNIENQLRTFMGKAGKQLIFKRLALNMNQVEAFNPPPSPVKPGDSRSKGYVEEFGTTECWELDALTPEQVDEIVTEAVTGYCDEDKQAVLKARQAKEKRLLAATSKNWRRIAGQLEAEMRGGRPAADQPPATSIDDAQAAPADDTQAPPDDEVPPQEYFADDKPKPKQ